MRRNSYGADRDSADLVAWRSRYQRLIAILGSATVATGVAVVIWEVAKR